MGMPVIVNSGIDREDAITDIIQSIALEETALSHILNAEGEKIQAAVAMKEVSIDELIKINSSVESMVHAVTKLEAVLQNKLSLFGGCLCNHEETEVIKK